MAQGNHVVQDWVQELTFKMQTVLLLGCRGPDTHHTAGVKKFTRYLRWVVLNNADPSTGFMEGQDHLGLPLPKEYEHEVEYCSVHFVTHLIHALTIVAYKHPDAGVRRHVWYHVYQFTDKILHLMPEEEAHLDARLADPKARFIPATDQVTQQESR